MRKILLIWLSILAITVPNAAVAGKTAQIIEEPANLKSLKYSDASAVAGLYHPGLEGYARLTGIDLNRVVSVLKLTSGTKGNSPAFIGRNNRYKTSGFRSVTARIFEFARVQIGGKKKILALYNDQMLDENNIEKFHRGWNLAELSEKYELEKIHNLFNSSKHPWPGGEAIYTGLKVKNSNLQIAITYEQPIRGSEVHTECDYNFISDDKGHLVFKGVREFSMEGPVE